MSDVIKQIGIEGKLYDLMPNGLIPVSGGGTGATNASEARENLEITLENIGAAPKEHTHDYLDLNDIGAVANEDIVPVSKGGTGGTTPKEAREKLGVTRANLGISFGIETPSETPETGVGAIYFKIV